MLLKDWIEHEATTEELLPLCHTTSWKNFEKILKIDTLLSKFSKFPDPNPANVEPENIVYLFYGMPFYIYEVGDGEAINSEVTEDLPIGLIFRPDLSANTDRFYPFDTGALLANKYKNILATENESEYKIYEVPITDGSELQKSVKRYYFKNENYCIGYMRNDVEPNCPKEENLLRLFQFSSVSKIDLRSRAIEIHCLNDIKLSHHLQAIILPRFKSKQYNYLVDKIKHTYPNIDIIYYRDFFKFNSESIRAVLLDTTANYYNNNETMLYSDTNI